MAASGSGTTYTAVSVRDRYRGGGVALAFGRDAGVLFARRRARPRPPWNELNLLCDSCSWSTPLSVSSMCGLRPTRMAEDFRSAEHVSGHVFALNPGAPPPPPPPGDPCRLYDATQ